MGRSRLTSGFPCELLVEILHKFIVDFLLQSVSNDDFEQTLKQRDLLVVIHFVHFDRIQRLIEIIVRLGTRP